jgi:hypothetical protein
MALDIKDGLSNNKTLKTTLDGADHKPHHVAEPEYASASSVTARPYSSINTAATFTPSTSAKSLIIYNELNADLYILLGSGTVTTSNFSYRIPQYGVYESLLQNCRLPISMITTATIGNAFITVTT